MSLKRWLFSLLGKDPEAVVVSFCSGPEDLSRRMVAEIRQLVPEREHFAVAEFAIDGVTTVHPSEWPGPLRRKRIGLAPVLFTCDKEHSVLRRQAFLAAPGKVLAYNSRLERHHLRLRTFIASLLFLRGVPLDRIWLRPRWLFPFKRDRSEWPQSHKLHEGRPLRAGRARIAVLSPYFPYPLSHGGAVRMYNLLREAARDYDLLLFTFADSPIADSPVLEFVSKVVVFPFPRYREPLWASVRPPQVNEFWSPHVARTLAEFRQQYSFKLLQIEYTQLATYSGEILVEHDVTFDLYQQIHEAEKRLRSWWDLWRWRRFERRAVRAFARTVVMSEKDAALLAPAPTVVIPNGVDLSRFTPACDPASKRVLFVGSFAHFPNVLAYRFFVEEVWPLLTERVPDVRFTAIAGRNPELYWSEPVRDSRIEFYGFISDVRPFYEAASLVVVPTRVSAGTNLKVLEAMAMERAIVSTTSGCGGIEVRHGESVWIADTAEQFAVAVARLLSDDTLRNTLATAGRRVAERQYDWSRVAIRQRRLWNELLSGVAIRKGTRDDLPAITAIQQEAHGASQWEPLTYFDFDLTVAERAGAIAGFIVTRMVAPGEVEILNVAVAYSQRRSGVASALLDSVEADTMFLEVRESNLSAQALYRKFGFAVAGRRKDYYDDPVENALVMRRTR